MILVKPSFEILSILGVNEGEYYSESLKLIELAGRTCYKSEDKITSNSAIKFVKKLNDLKHESVLEHSAMTVKFICDRGVSHELVRHRLASFSQESTRYCNYKGGVTFVIPPWVNISEGNISYECTEGVYFYEHADMIEDNWLIAMCQAEENYTVLLISGWSPQQARSVLPNSLKTELIMTTNFREWKHIFTLRCPNSAHPQMRELMIPLLEKCKSIIPMVFNDVEY